MYELNYTLQFLILYYKQVDMFNYPPSLAIPQILSYWSILQSIPNKANAYHSIPVVVNLCDNLLPVFLINRNSAHNLCLFLMVSIPISIDIEHFKRLIYLLLTLQHVFVHTGNEKLAEIYFPRVVRVNIPLYLV